MDIGRLFQYKEELQRMFLTDDAYRRIKNVGLWPNAEENSKQEYRLDAVAEILTFNECIRRPFYKVLQKSLILNIKDLFCYVKNEIKPTATNMLTYKEAFNFFSVLHRTQLRAILEEYAPQSAAFNQLLTSIVSGDEEQFHSALDKDDYTDLLSWSYALRLFLFGASKRNKVPSLKIGSNLWIKGIDYSRYFDCYDEDGERLFVEKEVKAYTGVRQSVRPCATSLSDTDFENYVNGNSQICNGKYYSDWITRINKLLDNGDIIKEDYTHLLHDNSLEKRCRDAIFYFLGENIRDNVLKVTNIFPAKPEKEKICRESVNNTWASIYVRNDEEELDFFFMYIVKHTLLMIDIYKSVSVFLSSDDAELLKWILMRSAYTPALSIYHQNKNYSFFKTHELVTITRHIEEKTETKVDVAGSDSEVTAQQLPTTNTERSSIKQKLLRPSELETFCNLLARNCMQNKFPKGIKYLDVDYIKDLEFFFSGNCKNGVDYKPSIWWKGSTASLAYVVIRLMSQDKNKGPNRCPNGTWPAVSNMFVFGDRKNSVTATTLSTKSISKLQEELNDNQITDTLTELDYIDSLFKADLLPRKVV